MGTIRAESAERGSEEAFRLFYNRVEPQLRRAFIATYGTERGLEATAEALTWAWEHHERLESMEHPVGFLFRVGQSHSRRRKRRVLHSRPVWADPWTEPELAAGLRRLSERQRVTVVLIHGYAWTSAEVAEILDCKVTTVQTHLERGLARLRTHLKAEIDE